MNRLYRPAATPSVATARSAHLGAGLELAGEAACFTAGEAAGCADPVGEQPGCTDDDPDGHRPRGSTRARTPRLIRRVGR